MSTSTHNAEDTVVLTAWDDPDATQPMDLSSLLDYRSQAAAPAA